MHLQSHRPYIVPRTQGAKEIHFWKPNEDGSCLRVFSFSKLSTKDVILGQALMRTNIATISVRRSRPPPVSLPATARRFLFCGLLQLLLYLQLDSLDGVRRLHLKSNRLARKRLHENLHLGRLLRNRTSNTLPGREKYFIWANASVSLSNC